MKTKKRTRAQILARLHEIAHDTNIINKHVTFDEPNKYVTVIKTLHKGKTMAEAHCAACGESYIQEPLCTYGYLNSDVIKRFKCPNCGNEHIAYNASQELENKRYKLIVKTEDGFEFLTFSSHIEFKLDNTTHEQKPNRRVNISAAGVFDRQSGFYIATIGGWGRGKEYKVLRRMSYDEESQICWLKDFTHSNVSKDDCIALLDEGNVYYANQQKEAKKKKCSKTRKEGRVEALESCRARKRSTTQATRTRSDAACRQALDV
jgi:predicted RNA-binding Zn-ribbon protein involved in translation (DUF1610 family)